jgi:cysteine desulfurase/selenocysteine lyase
VHPAVSNGSYDVTRIRANFLTLALQVYVKPLVYLDNAASAQTPKQEDAREIVRTFLNAPRKKEIIHNATEAINLVGYTSGHEHIKAGGGIVLSIMEYYSNIVPWHFLRERYGAVIKWAPVDEEGNFLLDKFEKFLTPRTNMEAITQMSNAASAFET